MPSRPFDLRDDSARLTRIHELLEGPTPRAREAEILELLRCAAPAELDHLLQTLDVRRLVADVDDRVFGPDHRTALFRMLCEERLADLSIPARARVVAALQRGATSRGEERAIAAIFLGTRGAELTALKNAVERAARDHHDLQQLFFRDVDDGALRDAMLAHVAAEAVARRDLKILSDIDDTLYRNWKDERYPKRRDPETDRPYLYPGVRAFYVELDVAFGGGEPQDLTFLTARPGDRAGLGEGITRGHLAELGFSYAGVTTGDFVHLLSHELMAERKTRSFIELRRLFPEYRFVFCGDSGQGDAIAGKAMMAHPDGGMVAVFIHDVVGTSMEEREDYRRHGVYFHDTYVGAAVDALALDILDLEAVRRVAQSAIEDMRRVPFTDAAQRDARLDDLRRDVARVNARLPEGERLEV